MIERPRETHQANATNHRAASTLLSQPRVNSLWRVFCAIELPERLRAAVIQHIESLKEALPGAQASWSRDGNLHLTLKFLGEVSQSSVQAFSDAVSRAVAGRTSFPVLLERAGLFPKQGSPRVLWIGITDLQGRLGELYTELESESAKAGFEKEKRSFHPHLTVARLRKPQHARTLGLVHKQLGFGPVEIMISELLVIRSELSSEGSKYTVISRHPLSITSGGEP